LDVTVPAKRCFQLVLIKPSHYDDEGCVIRWWRAMIPSNSLAAIYGIAADCAERQVLGPAVAISIEAIDETQTRVKVPAFFRIDARMTVHCLALTTNAPVSSVGVKLQNRVSRCGIGVNRDGRNMASE
jgi:hypothetical protein